MGEITAWSLGEKQDGWQGQRRVLGGLGGGGSRMEGLGFAGSRKSPFTTPGYQGYD